MRKKMKKSAFFGTIAAATFAAGLLLLVHLKMFKLLVN
jgi:hypothetical protein